MKAVVFMCLTIVGAIIGLYLGEQTYEPTRDYNGFNRAAPTERAKYITLFTLGGVAAGAGLGWAACNIEKFGDWK